MKYVHFYHYSIIPAPDSNLGLSCPVQLFVVLQLCARGRSSLFVSSISGPEPVLAARRWLCTVLHSFTGWLS